MHPAMPPLLAFTSPISLQDCGDLSAASLRDTYGRALPNAFTLGTC
jgi:hypothetical protein